MFDIEKPAGQEKSTLKASDNAAFSATIELELRKP
jgi:hypothetical protein